MSESRSESDDDAPPIVTIGGYDYYLMSKYITPEGTVIELEPIDERP